MFTRYDSFVILADSLQWDEATIDFTPDKAAWPTLDDTENAQVLGLIAGFCIAESAVSGHLGSFRAAASDDWVAACFAFILEKKENWRLLWWLFLQRFCYRQVMYYVMIKSVAVATRGKSVGWGKLDRKATVEAQS